MKRFGVLPLQQTCIIAGKNRFFGLVKRWRTWIDASELLQNGNQQDDELQL